MNAKEIKKLIKKIKMDEGLMGSFKRGVIVRMADEVRIIGNYWDEGNRTYYFGIREESSDAVTRFPADNPLNWGVDTKTAKTSDFRCIVTVSYYRGTSASVVVYLPPREFVELVSDELYSPPDMVAKDYIEEKGLPTCIKI